MKELKRLATMMLAVGMLLAFSGCGDDDPDGPVTPPVDDNYPGFTPDASDNFTITKLDIGGEEVWRLIGTINRNFTMDGDTKIIINGGVFVADGATLEIEAGTVIYGDANSSSPSFLSVLRGGQIDAQGTSTNPIIMTSSKELAGVTGDPASGDWGGLVVNGRAELNTGDVAEGEGGTGAYGPGDGNAPVNDDNSGTIRYLVLKYAGRIVGVDNELNGFSFNGVGSATTIEYIQSWAGKDDGVEFFGGRARVKYAVSTLSDDDSFDWTDGWQGYGQFWLVIQDGTGDHGFEGDNNGDQNTAAPYSDPRLANITLYGGGGSSTGDGGMLLREGTKALIWNAIVTGYTEATSPEFDFKGFGVATDQDETLNNISDGSLDIITSVVYGNTTNFANTDGTPDGDLTDGISTDGEGITLEDGVGVTTGGTDPSAVDGWFTPTTNIGAVDPAANWLTGWALKPDGSTY